MECELTKPHDKVSWLKDGQNINRGRVQILPDNCSHRLVINDVTINDGGRYTCVCGDNLTECKITVQGKRIS